jgi:ABC-type multidrug transport system ATPase subunit
MEANNRTIDTDQGSQLTDSKVLTLEWENVSVFTPEPNSKQILFSQKGSVEAGKVLAIVGATTLLNYLSGYIDASMKFSGSSRIGGVEGLEMSKLRTICGYVLQEDILSPELTVQETIEFSAKFRLPPSYSGEEIKAKVDETVKILELGKCRDTRIGDGIKRGVSGGERKRAMIAAEIITDPKLLLLDEPTTGLDSVNAENVVLAMKEMARRDKIVVTTIHQPSVDLLKMFDEILILHEGKKVFMGSFEDMRPFFGENGIKIPEYSNPVEFVLNILNLDPNSCRILEEQVSPEFGEIYNPAVIKTMEKVIEAQQNAVMIYSLNDNKELVNELVKLGEKRRKSFWKAFSMLFSKFWTIFKRNEEGLKVRMIMAVSQIVIATILFWNMGYDDRGIQNRKGVLYYVMMYSAMMTLQVAAFAFGQGRDLLKKELLQGQYTPSAYFFGRTLPGLLPTVVIILSACSVIFFSTNMNAVNLQHLVNYNFLIMAGMLSSDSIGLMLASAFGDPEKTIALVPIFITPLSLFAGLLVDIGSIAKVLAPFKYISFFRFMYEGLILNEFNDINDCKNGICEVPSRDMSFTSTVGRSLLILFLIAGVSRTIAAVVFHLNYKKFSHAN